MSTACLGVGAVLALARRRHPRLTRVLHNSTRRLRSGHSEAKMASLMKNESLSTRLE